MAANSQLECIRTHCACREPQPAPTSGGVEGWCFDCEKPATAECVEGEHAHQLAVTEEEYEAMTTGYVRRKCSICGEGLGFTEGDPCDRHPVADAPLTRWEQMESAIAQIGLPGVWRAAVFEVLRQFRADLVALSRDDEAVARQIVDRFLALVEFPHLVKRTVQVEMQKEFATALAANRNAQIEAVKAKRDEWQRLVDQQKDAPYEPVSAQAQVYAANEIITTLQRP